MKVNTLQQLVNWSSAVHQHLAERLETAAASASDSPARLFVNYAVDHERKMAEQVAGLGRESDSRALETWVYDWLEQPPRAPEAILGEQDRSVDLEALSRVLFSTHNEVAAMFRQIQARADVAEVEELVNRMIEIEEGHTRQMAQQLNRTLDM